MLRVILFILAICIGATGFFESGLSLAADSVLALPAPDRSGGIPLMRALNERRTDRGISSEALSNADLSNLLWAAWGINRSDGRRTIPTARGKQDINLYLAIENGVWLYEAKEHRLRQVLPEDYRGRFGNAAVTLLFASPADDPFAGMHIGSMYQNAGLYCASAGLANVVKASGTDVLAKKLPLPAGYKIFIVQSIGHPKK
ncbi:MAG: nitroreductase family protein [Deltaproteobacteria bacterium]|jgi:hypothetical protein|nr:nitroreductase family protein [Deltaproteobacteria bacterium]